MSERRQATRREPIEVEVRDHVYVARPLPWQTAGDLGNAIIQQGLSAVNDSVRLYMQDDVPQLEMRLGQKITDWYSLLKIGYPDDDFRELGLDIDECAVLVIASLEVNHLEHLTDLVDPNALPPMSDGGTSFLSGIPQETGPKIESSPGSSSADSPDLKSLPSPAENSSQS